MITGLYWEGRGNCPKCGKFCSNILGEGGQIGLLRVMGICKIHGEVDLTHQPWMWDDFFRDEDF